MRSTPRRCAPAVLAALFLGAGSFGLVLQPAHAGELVVAQQTGETGEGGDPVGDEQGTDQQEGEGTGGEGQSDPESEVGAEEGQTEEVVEETGPPWTYQMARIVIVLLVLLGLGIGYLYYRFVLSRTRGAV